MSERFRGTSPYERIEHNDSAAAKRVITVDESGAYVGPGGSSSSGKATDAYGYQAKSDDGTYKYFFFEDADKNYYIMRKNLTTGQIHYTKGTGGYEGVYVDKDSAPSGSPTWDSYGDTF